MVSRRQILFGSKFYLRRILRHSRNRNERPIGPGRSKRSRTGDRIQIRERNLRIVWIFSGPVAVELPGLLDNQSQQLHARLDLEVWAHILLRSRSEQQRTDFEHHGLHVRERRRKYVPRQDRNVHDNGWTKLWDLPAAGVLELWSLVCQQIPGSQSRRNEYWLPICPSPHQAASCIQQRDRLLVEAHDPDLDGATSRRLLDAEVTQ